jgi:hypothetical protein
MDEGLRQAARQHTADMVSLQQLAHQLPGEAPLAQRLTTDSGLHLDRAGENVAYAGSVDRIQDVLMHSPPHHANLVDPGFNVAGIGVVRSGDLLYVTQDFGHSLPTYSSAQSDAMISASVERARSGSLAQLQRTDGSAAAKAACAMADSNSLQAQAPDTKYILRFTSDTPEQLPASAAHAVNDPAVRAYAVGTCYARSASYPSGTYWVIVLFY